MQSNSQRRLETALQEGYSVNIGTCISEGWQILSQGMGGFVGFTLIIFLINVGLGLLPAGGIVTFVIGAPLNAGYFCVAFKLLRSQATTFGDFFRGFNDFTPLFIATILSSLVLFVASLPALAAGVGFLWPIISKFGVAIMQDQEPSPEEVRAVFSQLNFSFLFLSFLLYLPVIYLAVSYSLWIPLILDRKMQPWTAIETSRRLITKNWFGFFALVLVLGILNLFGALLCGVGIIFTLPLMFCALAVAYREIAGLAMPLSTSEESL